MPTGLFDVWAQTLRPLPSQLARVIEQGTRLGVPSPIDEEWFELLQHKLMTQVEGPPLLVAAIAGGTNIGKSVVFNHLAGEAASGSSAEAAKTRHPVALVPAGFDDPAALARLFQGFELRPWGTAADPWDPTESDLLFWRSGDRVPPRLVLLDSPDVDSDVSLNWRRADTIRRSADVLIAILTQQNYNTAAVKRFFRAAAEADKPVIVVFNQVDLVEDLPVWPKWLATFAGETGVDVPLVYVVPHDRAAARELRLPFYRVGPDGCSAPDGGGSLGDDLAALHFDTLKMRTLRGALRTLLDHERGLPGYLGRLRRGADELTRARAALTTAVLARLAWPNVPDTLLVDEIQTWWDQRRSPWARQVHGLYRTVNQTLLWPVRKGWQAWRGPTPDPLERFRRAEEQVIVEAVGEVFQKLHDLAEVGNDALASRLRPLLDGTSRAETLDRLRAALAERPTIDDEDRRAWQEALDRWSLDNPQADKWLRRIDWGMAVARPVVTLGLVLTGSVFADHLVQEAAAQVVTHTVSTVAAETAITTSVTAGGELAIGAAGTTLQQAAARLLFTLQRIYTERRGAWLRDWLKQNLLGAVDADLEQGERLLASPEWHALETTLHTLASRAALS